MQLHGLKIILTPIIYKQLSFQVTNDNNNNPK